MSRFLENEVHEIIDEAYQQGLEDAWECARKMYQFNPTNNKQLCEELYDMRFNEFICNTTAQEAMQKIKEYERKQKWSEQAKRGKERRDKIKKMLNKKQKVFCQKQMKKESE